MSEFTNEFAYSGEAGFLACVFYLAVRVCARHPLFTHLTNSHHEDIVAKSSLNIFSQTKGRPIFSTESYGGRTCCCRTSIYLHRVCSQMGWRHTPRFSTSLHGGIPARVGGAHLKTRQCLCICHRSPLEQTLVVVVVVEGVTACM